MTAGSRERGAARSTDAIAVTRHRSSRFSPVLILLGLAGIFDDLRAQDTTLTEIVLEMRVYRGGSPEVVVALARDSSVFLPLGVFLRHVELRPENIEPDSRFTGTHPRGTFEIDTRRLTARVPDSTIAIDSSSFVWRDGELFASASLLARILDVSLTMDWTELIFSVSRGERLPVVRRLARERVREAFFRPVLNQPTEVLLAGDRPPYDGTVIDWALTTSTREPLATSSLELSAGAQLLGGSLEVQHTEQRSPLGNSRDTRGSLAFVWPERVELRQLRMGNVSTEGRAGFPVFGGAVTNRPFLRRAEFATELLGGYPGPGWEIEVYRGDQLIGYAETDSLGAFVLPVPVLYGPNPFTLAAYGPGGRVRRYDLTFDIPFERLPAGQFEYAAGGGKCASPVCTSMMGLDARYGLFNRLTLQAGSDFFWRDTLPNAWHPYLIASAAATRSLSFTAEGVLHGLAQLRADYAPTPDLHIDATHTRLDRSDPLPIVGSLSDRHRTQANLFWRPNLLVASLFFQATASRAVSAAGSREMARLSATARPFGIRSVVGFRYEGESAAGPRSNRFGMEAAADALISSGPRWIKGTFTRFELGFAPDTGFTRVAAGLGRGLFGPLRLDFAVSWTLGQSGPLFDVGLQAALQWLRATSHNSYTQGAPGGVQGTQTFEGSVLFDRRTGRPLAGNGRGVGRAGISGEVFLDENGNGLRDGNEPAVPDVLLRVGARAVTTDTLGHFRVWDLVPFESATIEVDTLSISNPLWLPATAIARVRPTPNSFQFVSVPILAGGEVAGRVTFAATGAPASGVRVALVNTVTRATRYVTAFSDGAFYSLGLRPGTYEARLPDDLLARLGVRAAPVPFTVRAGEGAEVEIRLEARN